MHATERPLPRVLNLPNLVTAARLVLGVLVFVLLAVQWYPAALIVFVVAASTDWVDGQLARRLGQCTQLGRIFDPLVDKFIVLGTFVFLTAEPGSGIAAWVTVVVVTRELLVTVMRSYLEQLGKDFSAAMSGKLKMVFQCIAAGASMAALTAADWGWGETTTRWYGAAGSPTWLVLVLNVAVWLTVISTLYSGGVYVVRAARLAAA